MKRIERDGDGERRNVSERYTVIKNILHRSRRGLDAEKKMSEFATTKVMMTRREQASRVMDHVQMQRDKY